MRNKYSDSTNLMIQIKIRKTLHKNDKTYR